MKNPLIIILSLIFCLLHLTSFSQSRYSDHKTMIQEINTLAQEYPALCSVSSVVKTHGGRDIMVITIGTVEKDNKPGIAVVGGVEGNHLLGRELALGFASSLLKGSGSEEIRNLIGKVVFYVFPDVSPDAAEQYFQGLKYERTVNELSTDDDRDFRYDEDPFEDLNNDGIITLIRVHDPAGTYIGYGEDPRIMIPADLSKGQKGSFLIFTEGIDNDGDGQFNEDGPGGVNFNRNLTYNYEEFGLNAGLHPVSEPETGAVLDFLFDHYNIFTVITFGPQDNLGQPWKSSERPSSPQAEGAQRDRRITSVLKSDELINKLVSEKYHEITGVKGAPSAKQAQGNFTEWAYYHYGRYSFGTPAWWIPVEKDKNADADFLKYAEENNMEDVFVPWTEIKHPDFPGKKTEAGGIKPFVRINPPEDKLEELIKKNYRFITEVAAMHPELEFLDIEIENKGENIFRLSLKIHNKGIFATCAEVGANNIWTRLMRMSLEPSKNQVLLSGQKVQRMQRIEGDGITEFSWLIMGKGPVKISAGAVNTGFITTTADLK